MMKYKTIKITRYHVIPSKLKKIKMMTEKEETARKQDNTKRARKELKKQRKYKRRNTKLQSRPYHVTRWRKTSTVKGNKRGQ